MAELTRMIGEEGNPWYAEIGALRRQDGKFAGYVRFKVDQFNAGHGVIPWLTSAVSDEAANAMPAAVTLWEDLMNFGNSVLRLLELRREPPQDTDGG